jgi:hypothetical protein
MIQFLAWVVLLFQSIPFPGPGGVAAPPPAIALVAHAINSTAAVGVTTSGITTTGSNLLIAGCLQEGGQSLGSGAITDSKSNSWTALTQRQIGNLVKRLYYSVPTSVGASHTFTCTQGGSAVTIVVATFSAAGTSPFDKENGSAANDPGGGGAATFTGGSVTPTNTNSLIVSFIGTLNAGFGAPLSTVDSGLSTTDVATAVMGFACIVETSIVAKNPGWASTHDQQGWAIENAVFHQ